MGKKHYSGDTGLIILDWDGVAYPYSLKYVIDCVKDLVHQVVERENTGLPPEKARRKEEKIFNEVCRYALTHKGKFAGYFEKNHGMTEDEVLQDIRSAKRDMGFITPSADVRHEVERAQSLGVKLVILSQSDTNWLKSGVARLGIADLLGEDCLFGIDKTHHNKHDGTAAYQHVLDATGFAAEQALTVDDSKKNLRQALRLGIETAYIPKVWRLHAVHSINPEGTKHSHPNLLEFLRAFNEDRERALERETGIYGWRREEDARREERMLKRLAGR